MESQKTMMMKPKPGLCLFPPCPVDNPKIRREWDRQVAERNAKLGFGEKSKPYKKPEVK
jgi:hypothetical protein